MRSKFALAGHPIHPILVSVPIGLFLWVLVADVVYLARDREPLWYDMSYWAAVAGTIGAVVAAVFGIGDYFAVARKSDARDIATAHGVMNIMLIVLFGGSVWLMQDDASRAGRSSWVLGLHAVGVAIMAFTGWLGGELSFRKHIGMVPDDEEQARVERRVHQPEPDAMVHATDRR